MRDQYMRSGQGFIITYAINSRQSFDEVASFRGTYLFLLNNIRPNTSSEGCCECTDSNRWK